MLFSLYKTLIKYISPYGSNFYRIANSLVLYVVFFKTVEKRTIFERRSSKLQRSNEKYLERYRSCYIKLPMFQVSKMFSRGYYNNSRLRKNVGHCVGGYHVEIAYLFIIRFRISIQPGEIWSHKVSCSIKTNSARMKTI